jgi:hypothetical protein
VIYLDDIIVFSSTMAEHKRHLELICKKLYEAGIKLNKEKCELTKEEISILGHKIGRGWIKPNPEKVLAIKNFRIPNNVKELQSFIGMVGYTRRFIPRLSSICEPLFNLLKNVQNKIDKFTWLNIHDSAFNKIKDAITSNVILSMPKMEEQFILLQMRRILRLVLHYPKRVEIKNLQSLILAGL